MKQIRWILTACWLWPLPMRQQQKCGSVSVPLLRTHWNRIRITSICSGSWRWCTMHRSPPLTVSASGFCGIIFTKLIWNRDFALQMKESWNCFVRMSVRRFWKIFIKRQIRSFCGLQTVIPVQKTIYKSKKWSWNYIIMRKAIRGRRNGWRPVCSNMKPPMKRNWKKKAGSEIFCHI